MDKIQIMDHPLIHHKISILRDEKTGNKEFRELVDEIAMLMAYEATRDLPLTDKMVTTPCGEAECRVLEGKKLAIVPILRAGLGMSGGILKLIPAAKVGHIGLYRDHETLEPKEYYCKLPDDIENRIVIIPDPMLATGGSASAAISFVKAHGAKNIKFLCLIAAPEGVRRLSKDHPDVSIYIGCMDKQLNENGYIIPGLGDAGDRIFGTK